MTKFRTYPERRDAVEAIQVNWISRDYSVVSSVVGELEVSVFEVSKETLTLHGLSPLLFGNSSLVINRGDYLIRRDFREGEPLYEVVDSQEFNNKYDTRRGTDGHYKIQRYAQELMRPSASG